MGHQELAERGRVEFASAKTTTLYEEPTHPKPGVDPSPSEGHRKPVPIYQWPGDALHEPLFGRRQ